MKPPKFITVEGIEGVGKSTQVGLLDKALRAHGVDLVATREPGGTCLGERIRDLMLKHEHLPVMHADTELLLMFAARAEHLHQVVWPALAAGSWVICDRFTDASYAYQGGGRGIAIARIEILEAWVQENLRPDLTLLLDADAETALARAKTRGTPDRFEREAGAFFARVRRAYLERAALNPRRFRVIDATGSVSDVHREMMAACNALITAER